jgi:hypothetical protein
MFPPPSTQMSPPQYSAIIPRPVPKLPVVPPEIADSQRLKTEIDLPGSFASIPLLNSCQLQVIPQCKSHLALTYSYLHRRPLRPSLTKHRRYLRQIIPWNLALVRFIRQAKETHHQGRGSSTESPSRYRTIRVATSSRPPSSFRALL